MEENKYDQMGWLYGLDDSQKQYLTSVFDELFALYNNAPDKAMFICFPTARRLLINNIKFTPNNLYEAVKNYSLNNEIETDDEITLYYNFLANYQE